MEEESRQRPEGSDLAKKVKSLEEKEEAVLARAVAETMRRYNENPSVKNLREWDAAKARFAEFQRRKTAEAEPRFSNLIEVLGYLTGEGYKISKSKLYEDASKLDREKDGSILASSAERYAMLVGLPRLDGSSQESTDWVDKARLENEILEEKKRKLQRENEIEEGRWILKSEAEQMYTGRLALLLTAFDNFVFGGRLEEAIDMVGGDREKAHEFKGFIKRELRGMLAEYAKRPIFTVARKTLKEAEQMKLEVNGD